MSRSNNGFDQEPKDSAQEQDNSSTSPTSEKGNWFLSTTTKIRKRTGSSGPTSSSVSVSTPRAIPALKEGKREKNDEEIQLSPKSPKSPKGSKKGSPRVLETSRKESPRNESPRSEGSPRPRWGSKSSNSRLNALWTSGSVSSRSPSNSPRLEYNLLPITEYEISDCIERANDYIKSQAKPKVGFKDIYTYPDANGAGGVYMEAQDSENRYAVIITRPSDRAGWKYYLIEKIHLLIDENKKTGPQEIDIQNRSSVIGKGNEGRVVRAWDLQMSEIDREIIREEIAAKIYHLRSSDGAVLNAQLILDHLKELYGRFDYIYDATGAKIQPITPDSSKVTKKILFMKKFNAIDMMDILYKRDLKYREQDKERYVEKINHAPLYLVRTVLGLIRAARFLQDNDVTHRDLKPGNLLMDEYHTVKIIDYSSAKFTHDITGKEGEAGTLAFSAPELDKSRNLLTGLLRNNGVTNFKVIDNYSLGMSMFEILTSGNFRYKLIGKDVPARQSLQLSLEELKEMGPDMFGASAGVDLETKIQQFMATDKNELKLVDLDRQLQVLIYEACTKDKLVNVILALIKINPDERLSMLEAEVEVERLEQELTQTFQALYDILQAKVYLHLHSKLPSALINAATDIMADIERNQRGREKRRSYQQGKLSLSQASSSSSDSDKKPSEGYSSLEVSPITSPSR